MGSAIRNRIAAGVALGAIALCVLAFAPLPALADDASLAAGVIADSFASASEADSGPGTDSPDESAGAADPDPVIHEDGWEYADGAWHYWEGNEMVRGRWIKTKNHPPIKGAKGGYRLYWIAQDGALARRRLIDPSTENDAGARYCAYATKHGYLAAGKTVVGNLVYLARANGKLESGNKRGILTTKRYDKGTKRRYVIDRNLHAAITGKVVKVKGWGRVYAFPKKGYIARGVTKIDSTHVLLADSAGKLLQRKGWVTTKKYAGTSQRYWLERTKKNKNVYGARIGKIKRGGKLYFGLEGSGYVVRNCYHRINATYFNADSKGSLTRNDVITRMYRRAQGYSSPSRYLLMVDTDDTKFMVFEGSQGNWNVKYIWDCSTGSPSTPTVLGVFHIGIKGYSFGHGYTCYYYTQFYGNYLIHTRIYREGTHILQDASMNRRVSQGCVRLYDEDAYWVWRNVPAGTTMVTMV